MEIYSKSSTKKQSFLKHVLREDDCVIRTKTGSEKFWFSNFFDALKQFAKVGNHAKFQSIWTINGWDMVILSFELFSGAEFEKNRKRLLILQKCSDFDENQYETSLDQMKGHGEKKFGLFWKNIQVPLWVWFSYMCKNQGELQIFFSFFC